MQLNTPAEIIEDIRQGKMVILMDDEDRENEGDLVMAAEYVTPEAINFMAKYGRGLICLTLTKKRCKQLNLSLMVDANKSPFSTNFTVSIEAAEGVTTGRYCAAWSYFSINGPGWWCAGAGWSYRSGLRSGTPGGVGTGCRHCRNSE
jgi:hypothetical protein